MSEGCSILTLMGSTFEVLEKQAEQLGLTVTTYPLSGPYWGLYDPATKTIYIRKGLYEHQRAATLAHELIHAYHGHEGHQCQTVEDRVNEEAATLLISESAYREAELALDTSNPGALAAELGTSRYVVEAYQRHLRKHLSLRAINPSPGRSRLRYF